VLEVMRTTGDAWTGSLASVGGKGLFVKELEEALLDHRIDLAVHSLKDMPAELPPGLALVATPVREDARDVLVSRAGAALAALGAGTSVGTSSLRRRAQLLAVRPDLTVVALRGNVDSRLAKLARGEVDAVMLAAAGLRRLGLTPPGACVLPADEFLPAIGQGALALEARADDTGVRAIVAVLDDPDTSTCVAAERAFLAAVGGDCHTPLAAHTGLVAGRLTLRALVADIDGTTILREQGDAASGDAASLGRDVATRLLARGAGAIIAQARGAS
jgi:hydroxymethylbilane synthase